MAKLSLVTGPQQEPVSLDDIKNHLRVDITNDDELIMAYMLAARESIESISNQRLVSQTWDIWLEQFPGSTVYRVPRSLTPLQSVTHVKYWDADDQEQTFDSSNYLVDTYAKQGQIVLQSSAAWPGDVLREVNGVNIRVVVGFGDDADVPERYKQAIKLLVGHWYENREQVVVGRMPMEIPFGVKNLLWHDRVIPI